MSGTTYQKKLCAKQVWTVLRLHWISCGYTRDLIPQQFTDFERYIKPEPDNVTV